MPCTPELPLLAAAAPVAIKAHVSQPSRREGNGPGTEAVVVKAFMFRQRVQEAGVDGVCPAFEGHRQADAGQSFGGSQSLFSA